MPLRMGYVTMGVDHTPAEWHLHQGEGQRQADAKANFGTGVFTGYPTVIVGLAGVSFDRQKNQQLRVFARGVTQESCEIVFETDGDSKVLNASAVWLAYRD